MKRPADYEYKHKLYDLIKNEVKDFNVDEEWLDGAADMLGGSSVRTFRHEPRFLTLQETKEFLDSNESYEDFVYVRPWGLTVFNVSFFQSHECFMAILYQLFNQVANATINSEYHGDLFDDPDKDAEKFMNDDFGFYMSSVSGYGGNKVYVSADMKLTGMEKRAFSSLTFDKRDYT